MAQGKRKLLQTSVSGGENPTLNGGARLSKSVNNRGQSLAPMVEHAGR